MSFFSQTLWQSERYVFFSFREKDFLLTDANPTFFQCFLKNADADLRERFTDGESINMKELADKRFFHLLQEIKLALESQGAVYDLHWTDSNAPQPPGSNEDIAYVIDAFRQTDASTQDNACINVVARAQSKSMFEESLKNTAGERERFYTIFEASPEGISISDLETGKFLDVNESFCELTGYAKDTVIGNTANDLGLWIDKKQRERLIHHLELVGEIRGAEFDFRIRGDRIVSTLFSASVLRYHGRKCIIALVIDMTSHREAEHRAMENANLFSLAFHSTPHSTTVKSLETDRFIEVNNGFCNYTGFTREEVIGKTPVELNLWQDDNMRHLLEQELKKHGSIKDFQCTQLRKDGSTYVAVMSAETLTLSNEFCAVILTVDISERKKQEQLVFRLQHLLAGIIDAMPSVVITLDSDCKVEHWNERASAITGIEKKMAMGRSLADVSPHFALYLPEVKKTFSTGKTYQEMAVPGLESGRQYYEDVTVFPVRYDGEYGAVIRIDDATDRVRLQHAMIQTEKMNLVSSLTGGMAHEINNPLSTIMQHCQNIIRRFSYDIDENARQAKACGTQMSNIIEYVSKRSILSFLEDIREDSARAADIVERMIQLSSSSTAEKRAINIHTVLEHAIELASKDYDLSRQHDFRNICLRRDYDRSLPKIPGISTELEQVFINILRNASSSLVKRQKTKRLSPVIAIKTHLIDDMVCVDVSDNGVGMPESVRQHAFDPFFTTKPVGSGTGVGLSVVYAIIINDHGGNIQLQSTLGKGTTISVRLPVTSELLTD